MEGTAEEVAQEAPITRCARATAASPAARRTATRLHADLRHRLHPRLPDRLPHHRRDLRDDGAVEPHPRGHRRSGPASRPDAPRVRAAGQSYVSPRVTQVYHTGVCIYFTHGFSARGVERPDQIFAQIERACARRSWRTAARISHHHGMGKLRRYFVDRVASPETVEAVKSLKHAVDPQNVCSRSATTSSPARRYHPPRPFHVKVQRRHGSEWQR